MVRGPAELSLEAVDDALDGAAIALVGVMHSVRSRDRFLYGLAACLMLAAMFATFRKSALLVPASVILTLACFRRRELMKLAPLASWCSSWCTSCPRARSGSTRSSSGRTGPRDRERPHRRLRRHPPGPVEPPGFGRGWGAYDHRATGSSTRRSSTA